MEIGIQQVCAVFALGDPVSVNRAGGSRNKSFFVSTAKGKWFVRKRYPGYADEDRVRFDHNALCFLAENGVAVVPPCLSREGKTWWNDAGDVQPANILLEAERVKAFVDLDWCAWRPRLYDLGWAIMLCCANHDKPIGEGDIWSLTQYPRFNPRIVRDFLKVYQESGIPLSKEEERLLPSQLMLTWCHQRIHGSLKVPVEQRHKFLAREKQLDLTFLLPSFHIRKAKALPYIFSSLK